MFKTIIKTIALGGILWGTYHYSPLFQKSPQQPIIKQKTAQLKAIDHKNPQDNLELKLHRQVNQYRQSRNLSPLELDNRISQQARLHSQTMAAKTISFSHEGFEKRVEIISRQISLRSAAENLAYNQGHNDPVSVAVKGWIKSPSHHKNMIGNFNLTGIGIAKNSEGEYYFTQIFILQK
jgi:uncharacterized protein YkwD